MNVETNGNRRYRKEFGELTAADDFMFAKVMLNRRLCRRFLELVLSVRIRRLTYPQEQKTIDNDYDAKSIRLDVYVDDEKGTVYDIEMQASRKPNLPRRSRYYQGAVDLELLERGMDYDSLPESYIIFVCTFDPFGGGRHIYTFRNLCCEDKGIMLEDGAAKVFVSTEGTPGDIHPELQDVMDYLKGKPARGGLAMEMEKEVRKVKKNKKWRREYMTLAMIEKECFEEGREEGKAEGREEGRAEGRKCGIINAIKVLLSFGADEDTAIITTAAQYGMPADEIRRVWERAEEE